MTNTTRSNESKGFLFDGLFDGVFNAADTIPEVGMSVAKAGITITEEVAALGIDIGSQIVEEVVVSSARSVVRSRNGYNSRGHGITHHCRQRYSRDVLSMFDGLANMFSGSSTSIIVGSVLEKC